ncbi:unnamed protein product [Paramecium pentaurelia]|uniref:WD40-repeat-containing domain n=1 Tax=Paramecium pentaurelia TaxID=43138 RepID=A0A8S1XCD9_9CILI|nr:unnamed protein product [Paramecium pentaurelia]
MKQILTISKQNTNFCFYDELDNLINITKLDEFNQESLINQINDINKSWNQKITNNFISFKQFIECLKLEDISKKQENKNEITENARQYILIDGNQETNIKKQKEVENQQQQLEKQQLIIDKQIELTLIDDSNQQSLYCYAIVFDNKEQIMISTCNKQIKIWNFYKGKFKLSHTYEKHQKAVTSLVYSKFQNHLFLVQMIKQLYVGNKLIKKSGFFHNLIKIIKIIQEDQLISGGSDKIIIVWQVDFMKNELTILYSLDSHANSVFSVSLNQSESLMAAKGLESKWELKFKQDISADGKKIHFINDQQFVWVPLNCLLMIFWYLNHKMESFNQILIRQQLQQGIINVKMHLIFQLYIIRIKIQYQQDTSIISIQLEN